MNGKRFGGRDECAVPTFGCPMANNGWVQCPSKTFPGKYYYFNVDSRCRTWGRPVSSHVTVPIVNPTMPNFQCDVYDVDEFDEVSDIEEDDPLQISAKRRKTYDEILFKLYHCEADDEIADVLSSAVTPFACETQFIKEEVETKDEFLSIFPEICYSSSSDSESIDGGGIRRNQCRLKRSHSSRVIENRVKKSEIAYDRFGRLNLCGSENSTDRQFYKRRLPADFSLLKYHEGSSDYDGETEDEEDEDFEDNIKMERGEINDNVKLEHTSFSLPRLKVIQLSDLINEPTRHGNPLQKKASNRKVRKAATVTEETENPQPNKIKTFIHEINGVKTISYDFVAPELPPGVKASNLSDSEVSTIETALFAQDKNRTMKKEVKIEPPGQRDFPLQNELFNNIKVPCLSESSASSSSSSLSGTSSDSESSSSHKSESSSDSSDSSDCSCSNCSSSTSSSASLQSFSHKVKKEVPDSGDMSTPIKQENSMGKILKNFPICEKMIKVEATMSPSSSNSDKSWKILDNSSEDDDY
ncbi:dentin sialophosphoprotein-like [Venturia canescens]|uniref:dentin sialophosphoprotein-like n=1 Tax=Venturia canescens TaxID=32260 RepID=UPI001C9C764F|nr:dentin sialophosphoprotein-like [Venturia canescens]